MTKEAVSANVKWNCALRMVYPAFARRQVFRHGGRPWSGTLCVAAACAALATLIIAWLVLAPVKARLPVVAPAVTLHWQTPAAGGSKPAKPAAAPAVDNESLSRALVAVDYSGARGLRPTALAALAEQARPSLQLEALVNDWTDSPGTSGVTLRWRGAVRDVKAAALVEALARELAFHWQAQAVEREEQASADATQVLTAAAAKVQSRQAEFEAALTRLGESAARRGASPTGPAAADGPTLAPPEPAHNTVAQTASASPPAARPHVGFATASRQARLESELEDLEIKRDSLAERLTPSHPEMRAIDEQIGEVRAALANASYPATEEPLPEPGTTPAYAGPAPSAAVPAVVPHAAPWRMQALTQTQAAWRRLTAALAERENAAIAASHAQTELLRASQSAAIERLPAAGPPAPAVEVSWSLVAVALLAAGAAAWLVMVVWPAPGAVVIDADELRRTTRLPVIVVPAAPSERLSPSFDSKWRIRPAFAECMQSADRRSPAPQAGLP